MIPAAGCDYRQPGALNPSVGVRRQLPLHKGAVFACGGHNQPPFYRLARQHRLAVAARHRHPAKIAPRPLPGDGLSHPEQSGQQRIKPSARFGRPDTGRRIFYPFSSHHRPGFSRSPHRPHDQHLCDYRLGGGLHRQRRPGELHRKKGQGWQPNLNKKPPEREVFWVFTHPSRLCLPGQRKAPLVAAWRRCHIKGDCEARQMIQLGAVIGCGSTAWPWRLATGTLPIPQSAFADSSLCTREVR